MQSLDTKIGLRKGFDRYPGKGIDLSNATDGISRECFRRSSGQSTRARNLVKLRMRYVTRLQFSRASANDLYLSASWGLVDL